MLAFGCPRVSRRDPNQVRFLERSSVISADGLAVALMFHGGAFCFGEDHNVPPAEVNYLNEKGVVVVSAQYRLSPQYVPCPSLG